MLKTQLFLVIFLKFLIFHHGVVKVRAFPESEGEETKELNFEYSNSMDEDDFETDTTTLANFNELYELSPPIIFSSSAPQLTATTLEPFTALVTMPSPSVSVHKLINQTSSLLLMKLIAPIESTAKTLITKNEDEPKEQHQNDETHIASSKKPRLLSTKFKSDIETDVNSMEKEDDTTTTPNLDSDNETNVDLDEITTIPSPTSSPPSSSTTTTTSKRPPKNIEIFKTRPNELLRFYVEDSHLRSPVAALVNKKSNPLSKAKKLWKAALRPNSLLDIMVISYDSEGIKSTYNLTNTKAMMNTLDKVREENVTDQESKTYYSIIRTGQLIPFDSAIFLSTDELPNDTEHQLQASMFLLKKRIRLYLIMFDDNHLSSNETLTNSTAELMSSTTEDELVKETGFLGQLALLSGGDILYVPNHVFQSDNNDGEMGYITLIRRNKLKTIDQDPVKDFHENELRNDTDTFNPKEDDNNEATLIN